MRPTERLAALGLVLPPVAKPVANYIPAVLVGNQVWTSGQLPSVAGSLLARGKCGAEVDQVAGAELAQIATLNALAAVAEISGGLDRIRRVLKVVVFVASDLSFTAQPQVANGASELLGKLFESGHVRSAVGVSVLPLDSPIEVELVVELHD